MSCHILSKASLKLSYGFVSLAALAVLAGCATAFVARNPYQITSDPPGAGVYARTTYGRTISLGTTPHSGYYRRYLTRVFVEWSDGLSSYSKALSRGPRPVLHFTRRETLARMRLEGKLPSHTQAAYSQPDTTPSVSERPIRVGSWARPLADRWAVVVGVSRYGSASENGLSTLLYADDDATAFAAVLEQQGWNASHVKMLTDEGATKRNVEIALEGWLTKAGPDDLIVLFWSGHGFSDPEDPERVYFACYDTDIRVPATGYRMDKVRASLEEKHARNVVVFADTCHAGKLVTRGEKGIAVRPYIEKIRREKAVPKGWIFMVGADTDRLAIEHTSWSNGAFTHCLLKALSGGADGFESVGPRDGIVTMGELRAYMNTTMPDETQEVLGVAKRPLITTSTGDPNIWELSIEAK